MHGESDRIVTLLTDRHGRVGAIARGARASRRRFGGALEPFALLHVGLSFGAGELAWLSEARIVRAFPRLLGDFDAMREAGRVLELVRRIAPRRQAEPRLLDCVVSTFERLETGPDPTVYATAALRAFAAVGTPPRLDRCVACAKMPMAGQAALFDPKRGGLVCRRCGGGPLRLSAAARAWMTAVSEGHPAPSIQIRELADVETALDAFALVHAPDGMT